jgi:hypothetical protein
VFTSPSPAGLVVGDDSAGPQPVSATDEDEGNGVRICRRLRDDVAEGHICCIYLSTSHLSPTNRTWPRRRTARTIHRVVSWRRANHHARMGMGRRRCSRKGLYEGGGAIEKTEGWGVAGGSCTATAPQSRRTHSWSLGLGVPSAVVVGSGSSPGSRSRLEPIVARPVGPAGCRRRSFLRYLGGCRWLRVL